MTLSYALGGADAGLFTIAADDTGTDAVDEAGQIQVKTADNAGPRDEAHSHRNGYGD